MTATTAAPAAAPVRPVRFLTVRTALKSPAFVVGVVIIGFWVLCALVGSRFVPHDPFADGITQGIPKNARPSADYWFGTDRLGRDVFSRVIVGSRDLLLIAPIATALGTIAGTTLGLVTGYFRGVTDTIVSRGIEVVLSLPFILLALVVIAARGSSNLTVIIAIAVAFTPIIARTVRAAVLAQADLDYVQSARLRNERAGYVMFREILPNVAGPILVESTVRLGYAVFAVATLSFLGVGLQPPSPDWGLAVSENYASLNPFWWATIFPCLAIASLVVAVNLVADGLQEAQR